MRVMAAMVWGAVCLAGAACALGEVVFYVAPGAKEGQAGSAAAPFATLEQARDAVRSLKKEKGLPEGGVTVWVRGGEYELRAPLMLTPEDSGEPGKPIRYAACRGERPMLFGGRRVTGFARQAGGVWEATVPGLKAWGRGSRSIYVDGQRYGVARSPNQGYYEMEGPLADADSPESGPDAGKSKSAFVAPENALRAWPEIGEVNIKVWGRWWTALHRLQSVDPVSRHVRLTGPSCWTLPFRHRKKTPFLVENHPGALDAPGEWQADLRRDVLGIVPLPGVDLSRARVEVPVTDQLLVLAGDPSNACPVANIVFRGLTFRCSGWTLPPGGGQEGSQAAVNIGAVIEAFAARDCLFDRCEVTQTDTFAIWLRSGSRGCVIRQCHIHDLGAGGVKIGEAQKDAAQVAEPFRVAGNAVENCFIHHAGHVHGAGGIGVWIGASSGNTVAHNEICDLWYTGVSVGWQWGARLNDTRDNRVVSNRIHHVMQRLEDGGGIYCLGFQPGTVLANNIIHDSGWDGGPAHCRGIYLDEGCVGYLVENNLVYDTQDAALRMQIGTGCNTFINNILAFTRVYAVDMDVARSCVFINNIVYLDRGRLYKFEKWPHYEKYISKNLYWRTDGEPFLFAGQSFETWRGNRQTPFSYFKGGAMDSGSALADPKFEDAEKRDFRLRPDSPAFALGFKPIDLEAVGLRGEEEWRTLPRRARVRIAQDDDKVAVGNSALPANAATSD